jgi:hypothetical protein
MAKINCTLGYIIFLSICSIGRAQAPQEKVRMAANSTGLPEVHLRVDTSLVLVPVHASNKIGTPITDLTEANFRVFEDGAEQKVTYFAKQDAPVSVGLVFDSSGSMIHKIRKSAEAADCILQDRQRAMSFLGRVAERPKLTSAPRLRMRSPGKLAIRNPLDHSLDDPSGAV